MFSSRFSFIRSTAILRFFSTCSGGIHELCKGGRLVEEGIIFLILNLLKKKAAAIKISDMAMEGMRQKKTDICFEITLS